MEAVERNRIEPGAVFRPVAAAVLALAWLVPPGGGVAAQGADPDPADTIPVMPHPELVVRATRLPLPAEALPFAVTVRRPVTTVPAAGWSLAEELRAVPGLQVQSRHNEALGDRIVMRGFGARAQFGVRGVHAVVDGIPATMPDGQTTLNHLDLSVLERAEVLRGPAAASWGNAAGGVLVLSTRAPPDGIRHELALATGGQGLYRARATTGGSADDVVWIGSLSREHRDGFRPHSGLDRYQGTGRFDAPLAGGNLRVVSHAVSYDARNPGALTPEQFADDPYQPQGFNVTQGTGETGRHGQVGATWERTLGAGRVEATAYGLARRLENPIPPSIIDLDRTAAGLRTLFRSAARPDRGGLHWALGLDAALQADDRQNHENDGGRRGALTLDQSEAVSTVAVFGQAVVPVIDRVGLYLGARYDRIGFSADDRFITDDNPDDSGGRAMDALSPTAGLRVRLTSRIQLFGNVGTAFQTPTTTELVNRPDGAGGFNPELEPQRTLSYEVGGRATLMSMLFIEAAAYRARIRDALVPFEVPTAPGRQFFRNAGEAEHTGVEVAAELRTRRVDVLASYSRTDARFGAYTTEAGDHRGNAVPGIRPWLVEAVVVGRPGRRLSVQLEYEGTGAMAADDANSVEADGYHLVGLRTGARGLRLGGLRVSPFGGVDNLFDRAYVASVVPNAFGDRFLEPGPGRTFYLGLELALGGAGGPSGSGR